MPPELMDIKYEEQLFQRLKTDPEVIGEIYDRYHAQIYSFLLKRCAHKETAEDLVAQCFIKLMEQATKLEWRGVPIGAWLYRVAGNALNDHWRSEAFKKTQLLDDDTWDPPAPDDPEWNAEITIERERLMSAMSELSERDQQVLSLRFYGGYKTEDVAAEMGISNNHAAVLIYRALGRMRKLLIAQTA